MTIYNISDEFKAYLFMMFLKTSHLCVTKSFVKFHLNISIIKRFEKEIHDYIRFIKNPIVSNDGDLILDLWGAFKNVRVETINYTDVMEVEFTIDSINKTRILDTQIIDGYFVLVDERGLVI
ncbi:MAG: hypothetical protein KAS32_26265 [Candidatus Peribacteraceae bacterium]|nr:hypothetical protein [Candidatus Peribacteraceae bacterium]